MAQGFGTGLRPFIAGGWAPSATSAGATIHTGPRSSARAGLLLLPGGPYDTGGQDVYSSAQYSQGSGIHLASGILVDAGGDDQFISRRGPSQGAAHDLSTGFLLDMEGEDCYATDGGQGLALTNSAAVFADLQAPTSTPRVWSG